MSIEVNELEEKVLQQQSKIRDLEIELQILSDAYDDAVEIFGKDNLDEALLNRLTADGLDYEYEPFQY